MYFERQHELATRVAVVDSSLPPRPRGSRLLSLCLSLSLSLSPSERIADAYREGIFAYLVCLSYGFYGEGVRRRRGEGFRAYLSRRQCNFPIPIPLVGRPGITSTCSFPFRCSYDMIAFQRIERGRKDHLLRHVLLQRK